MRISAKYFATLKEATDGPVDLHTAAAAADVASAKNFAWIKEAQMIQFFSTSGTLLRVFAAAVSAKKP